MTPLAILFLVAALAATSAAVAFWRRARAAETLLAELKTPAKAAALPVAAAAAVAAVEKPVPAPEPPAAPQPAPVPADDPLMRHAAKMVRGAHEIARNLGFDYVADPKRPTVYKITLSLGSEWDTRALEYAQRNPFPCVHGISIGRESAVILVDTATAAPE